MQDIDQSLSRYRILEKLGQGGMGIVYRARDEHLQRDVALKVLPPGLLEDNSAVQRFRREALLISRLDHPNIGTIYDFDSQAGMDFQAQTAERVGTDSKRLLFLLSAALWSQFQSTSNGRALGLSCREG